MKKTYYHNGKLLLSSEYVVLDGALALAVPTKKGQRLEVSPIDAPCLLWKSYNLLGEVWFEAKLFNNKASSNTQQTLEQILLTAHRLNPNFSLKQGTLIETFLTFPQNWGLGSSSTLICNIAQWAQVNPYTLLFESFGGSGYDIACGSSTTPILYKLVEQTPQVIPTLFAPSFANELFFVHLNQKQNSREGIARYRAMQSKAKQKNINELSLITEQLIQNPSKTHFCELIAKHEAIISKCIGLKPVKQTLFTDFQGEIKSLGAWGGDFILAVGNKNYVENYFKTKNYHTIVPFNEMVL